jgi:hypothetical protein
LRLSLRSCQRPAKLRPFREVATRKLQRLVLGPVELKELVSLFAEAIEYVDSRCAPYVTRAGRQYRPGIGPYPENRAMELVTARITASGVATCGQFVAYPASPRQQCDVWVGDPMEWAVEVKMGRFRGDNGKPDDTGIKDLISPFRRDRSALADGVKLAESGFPCRKAVVVYGFDDEERPLGEALQALDVLLRQRVTVAARSEATLGGLRHPVFSSGRVAGWEIQAVLA